MQVLSSAIEQMREVVANMPGEEVRNLEESMHRLTAEQIDFVRTTLENALIAEILSFEQYQEMEDFFEQWWTHKLPTKLAVISYVTDLSDSKSWPGDPLPTWQAPTAFAGSNATATLA
ncbi:MAG: hypothetical protein JSU63_17570 [Phycisphaerales bacterium]|nr:MAG: hypothetical protein JSU63_17570 [Phycisphaerales bacterium]